MACHKCRRGCCRCCSTKCQRIVNWIFVTLATALAIVGGACQMYGAVAVQNLSPKTVFYGGFPVEGPNYLPSLDTNPPYLETRGLPRSAANVQRTSGMSALYRLTSCFSIEDALFGNETLKGAQGIFQETFSEGTHFRRYRVATECQYGETKFIFISAWAAVFSLVCIPFVIIASVTEHRAPLISAAMLLPLAAVLQILTINTFIDHGEAQNPVLATMWWCKGLPDADYISLKGTLYTAGMTDVQRYNAPGPVCFNDQQGSPESEDELGKQVTFNYLIGIVGGGVALVSTFMYMAVAARAFGLNRRNKRGSVHFDPHMMNPASGHVEIPNWK